jgi:hypothetical protein
VSNRYAFTFMATCPVDGARITYAAEIVTAGMILAEDLLAWCARQSTGFHEAIADDMSNVFGGSQRITASHKGITITTVRPHDAPLPRPPDYP